jgi:hypothetical protein
MLNFTPNDYEQVEQSANNDSTKKWLTSMFNPIVSGSKPQSPNKTGQLNKSFTELLIQYVENESKPKPLVTFDLPNATASGSKILVYKKNDTPAQTKPSVFDRFAESQALTATLSTNTTATTNRFSPNIPSISSNANNKFLEDALS